MFAELPHTISHDHELNRSISHVPRLLETMWDMHNLSTRGVAGPVRSKTKAEIILKAWIQQDLHARALQNDLSIDPKKWFDLDAIVSSGSCAVNAGVHTVF